MGSIGIRHYQVISVPGSSLAGGTSNTFTVALTGFTNAPIPIITQQTWGVVGVEALSKDSVAIRRYNLSNEMRVVYGGMLFIEFTK